ncbi:MAG: Wadjet anti-phage system protein JetA family protein [Fusicatenibacter sp.]
MLFDVVPENFFRPLAAPGKIAYWECLCRLFAVTSRQLSFGVERDVLVDELQFYFDSAMAAQLSEEELEGANSGKMSSRDKANFVLRRLESYGWISVETDHSYVQRVNFRDYGVQMMKTLLNISEEKKTEYQGYIYTIYSLARSGGESPGIALLQIVENTDALVTGLKSLNANIKRYIDELTKHSTVAEILDALLNDYYSNVVDKAYHRLLTSDNVSKFRPEILERLEANSRSSRYLNKASAEIAELKEVTSEEAREQVLTMLHEVIGTFRQMDDILGEINKKNTRYQRAAINRARFLLSSGEDIRGQLKDILIYMNEQITEKELDYNAVYELEEMDRLIRIFSTEYLDLDSLYAPIEGKKEFVPEKIQVPLPDAKLRAGKRKAMMEKLEKILSPAKINAYVDEMLGERFWMLASEFPLSEGDTFIRLIYVRLYGQRKNMRYELELQKSVEKEGYRFRDFIIRRREENVR